MRRDEGLLDGSHGETKKLEGGLGGMGGRPGGAGQTQQVPVQGAGLF